METLPGRAGETTLRAAPETGTKSLGAERERRVSSRKPRNAGPEEWRARGPRSAERRVEPLLRSTTTTQLQQHNSCHDQKKAELRARDAPFMRGRARTRGRFTMADDFEDDIVHFSVDDLAVKGFGVMEEIRRQGKLCDVTLRVGEHKYSAHRVVLAASIPYFHAMFTTDMAESKREEIVMQGTDPSALEALINFAYNGRVAIDQHNVQALLMAASFLQLHAVKDACCHFLKERLHPKNVLGVRSFAEAMMCPALYDTANSFLQQHFVETSTGEEFLGLPGEELLELAARDELHVEGEEQVFEAMLAWVRRDREGRAPLLPDLLTCVRLPLCRPHFLTDRVQQDELIRACHKCRDLLDEAKDYHLMPDRRPVLPAYKTRPRCCTSLAGRVYAVGGLNSAGDAVTMVEVYDPLTNRWEACCPMGSPRSRVGVAVLGGRLYAVGGSDGQERLSSVEVYDPDTNTWTKVASMNSKRSAMGVAVLDGQIYVCGGYDGVSSLSSVECYSSEADKWTMVTAMNSPRSATGVAFFEGRVYVTGGHDGLQIFSTVEYYNPHTGSWHKAAPMQQRRCRHGAAALSGRLYAVGGYTGSAFLSSVETYDTASDQWSALMPMLARRSRVALAACSGRLYALGGYDGYANLGTVECFTPESNTWRQAAQMSWHTGGVGAGCLPFLTM